MADAALSVTASPLAALLAATTADSAAATATAQAADPFAALLATAGAPIANIRMPTAPATDPVATLLATAAAPPTNILTPAMPAADRVAALLATPCPLPVAPPVALPVTAAPAAMPGPPIAMAVDADGALPVTKKDADEGGKPATKRDSDDPLGDAIASGATAVLALAPAIVAPVPLPAPLPVQTLVHIEAPTPNPAAPKIGSVTAAARGNYFTTPVSAPAVDKTTGSTASTAAIASTPAIASTAAIAPTATIATTPTIAPIGTAADSATKPAPDQDSSAPRHNESRTAQRQAPDAKPVTAPLSPEALKAVVAALQQGDGGTVQTDPATPVAPVAPAATLAASAKAEAEQSPQPAVQVAQQQAAPVQAPSRRRGDEIAAPRRASDTRKRVDPVSTDGQPVDLSQRATDTTRAAPAEASATVATKGDAVVQQTLAIAKDGAWLDKLAHDIASSAGTGNDLHFKLEPQNLGALSVAISQSADGASIRITADNDTTRNILLDAQPKLIAEARAQGLKVSDTHVELNQNQTQNHSQNQTANQDVSRWTQGNGGQNAGAQNGQNRQSSPAYQPFVSNLEAKGGTESESPERDSDALYA